MSAIAVDNDTVAASYDDGLIIVGGKSDPLTPLDSHTGSAFDIVIGSARGQQTIASSGADRKLRIWRRQSGLEYTIDVLEPARGVVFVKDGLLVAATGPALCGWQLS